jgi:hypothetical protein
LDEESVSSGVSYGIEKLSGENDDPRKTYLFRPENPRKHDVPEQRSNLRDSERAEIHLLPSRADNVQLIPKLSMQVADRNCLITKLQRDYAARKQCRSCAPRAAIVQSGDQSN